MSKQDRQGVRTPADLERKYEFKRRFEENAKAVEDANKAVSDLDKALDAAEVFNRLTNYGKEQCFYKAEDGSIYINATYIKSGVLDVSVLDIDQIFTNTINAEQVTIKAGSESGGLSVSSESGHGGFEMSYSGNGMGGYETTWEAPGSALNIVGDGIALMPGGTHPAGAQVYVGGNVFVSGSLDVNGDLAGAFIEALVHRIADLETANTELKNANTNLSNQLNTQNTAITALTERVTALESAG